MHAYVHLCIHIYVCECACVHACVCACVRVYEYKYIDSRIEGNVFEVVVLGARGDSLLGIGGVEYIPI